MIIKTMAKEKSGLGQYAKQIIALLCCLLALSFYQHIRLYFEGLVDQVVNQSLWLHFINQIGFTSLLGLLLLGPYLLIEEKLPGKGKKTIYSILFVVLSLEYLLTTFYINTHNLFSSNLEFETSVFYSGKIDLILMLVGLFVLLYIFRWLSRNFNWASRLLKKMFPLTIVLFIMVLGMLFTAKKPINQNKFQFLVTDLALEVFDFNKYDGNEEFPFLTKTVTDSVFTNHFRFKDSNPNIVMVIVQGLGNDFVGHEARFKEFAPFLNKLSQESLFWKNHLSNSLDTKASILSLVTSLPVLESKKNSEQEINRNSLFGLFKENGYKTAFYYGGNNVLLEMDKFLFQDRVDLVVDKSKFDEKYQLSAPGYNGTIQGYPDSELFRKWEETYMPSTKPKFELFLNLSSAAGGIPESEKYVSHVENIIKSDKHNDSSKWVIERQKEFFSSMLYVDKSIENFIEKQRQTKEYNNTIYIITGTQNPTFLTGDNDLGDYHIPLMIFGANIKYPKIFSTITSHSDVAPSLLTLIEKKLYPSNPEFSAGLGQGLCETVIDKEIPLFRNKNRIKEFVKGNTFYKAGRVYQIGANLTVKRKKDAKLKKVLAERLRAFKAKHKYAVAENKILPDSLTVFRKEKNRYTSDELVWISSVFNGTNFDKAYDKARALAHNGNTERALLLSQYILDHVPNHVDALVLQGRIYAWNNKYHKAIEILKNAMANNPKYPDSYSAALDVCYWAKDKKLATEIYEKMKENKVISIELDKKVQRCLSDPKILNTVTALKFELDDD